MKEWQIKALEWEMENYIHWGNNAVAKGVYPDFEKAFFGFYKTIGTKQVKNENGEIVSVPVKTFFKGKFEKVLKRMFNQYENKNGVFEEDKTDEEKVNIIISKPNYKDRKAKTLEKEQMRMDSFKDLIKQKVDVVFKNTENLNKKTEIDDCTNLQDLSSIHYEVHILVARQLLTNQCLKIDNENDKATELTNIDNCISCRDLDNLAKRLVLKYGFRYF